MQGSGSKPYQTQIDVVDMACKCSCPSRKFPCKHGLGLLFLYASSQSSFQADAAEPVWVSDWIGKRVEKAANKTAEPAEVSADQAAKSEKSKAKTVNERLLKVQAGCVELDLWLKDLIRTGLISLPEKDSSFFQKKAARMVDAQAKGLAAMVKQLGEINYYNGTAWQSEALAQITDIFALLEAYKNIEKLPVLLQEDVRTKIGWNQTEEILETYANDDTTKELVKTVADEWLVLVKTITQDDDGVIIHKGWLYGCKSNTYALILNFDHVRSLNKKPIPLLVAGMVFKANLVFFPSNAPLRAFIKIQTENTNKIKETLQSLPSFEAAKNAFLAQKNAVHWTYELPQFIANLTLIINAEQWYLKDSEDVFLPLNPHFTQEKIWRLLAHSGGKPIDIFVLYTQNMVLPLGFVEGDKYQLL